VTENAPLLRVVRGDPTLEDLAAVIAVIAARGGAAVPPPAPIRSLWAAPILRTSVPTGPGAWRASTLPR